MTSRKSIPVEEDGRYAGDAGNFQSLPSDAVDGSPLKCIIYLAVEGWILFVSGIHPEAQEDDIYEAFADFGPIKDLQMNFNRRTGGASTYALLSYENLDHAQTAISDMNGRDFLGNILNVDFAFKKVAK